MFDLISIGDAVIDTFVPLTEAHVRLVEHTRELCLRYGDKIPVGDSISQVAGNAANSAVGGSRLKLKTAAYINVGADHEGQRIKDHLKEEGVNTRFVVSNKNLPSNHHIVLNYKGERTILIFHQPFKYNLPDLDASRWIYFTSLSPSFVKSNLLNQLENYLERTGAKLLYNPGTYQMKAGVKKNPRLLSLTEIFVVNIEEAKRILYGKDDADIPVKKLLKDLVDLGPRMVVITDGGSGSFGFDGEVYYQLDIFPAKLIEMTGAGDSYAAGLLAGLFHGKDLKEAMRWGAANGASVVEQVGPQPGLLTYQQMMDKLKENKKIIAKEI